MKMKYLRYLLYANSAKLGAQISSRNYIMATENNSNKFISLVLCQ